METNTNKITIDDLMKVEITVGEILSAEIIPESNKLLKLMVSFGSTMTKTVEGVDEEKKDVRQILSGIRVYFPDEQILVGKKCLFVTNLEPRMMMGMESNGMLFALSDNDGHFSLLEPNADIAVGTKAR